MKFEEIEKTLQAIEKKRNLLQKIFEEDVKKLESKKEQILAGDGSKKGGKKQVNEIDEESFPTM